MGAFPQNMIFKFLSHPTNGIEMAGASTTGTATFGFTAIAKTDLVRLNVMLLDGGITMPEFGGEAALTNGMFVRVVDEDGTEILDFTDGNPIVMNADWHVLAGVDGDPINTQGAGDDVFVVRWTMAKAGQNIQLLPGQAFQVIRRDSFVAITQLRMMIQGFEGK